ncbi:UNVERIFIED_CONTAM: hypothetical protein FKN15_031617 [Acipenser sinensis]
MNTRCPPKRAPSADRFFHTADSPCSHPRATASEDNAAFGQLTVKPAGARPDYRGRWCAVSRGHPGRPNPPSPQGVLGQLTAAPWKLPSSVGKGIAWTRTRDVQTIGHILHSTWSTITGCATREPQLYVFLMIVGQGPTSNQKGKNVMSDLVQHRTAKG